MSSQNESARASHTLHSLVAIHQHDRPQSKAVLSEIDSWLEVNLLCPGHLMLQATDREHSTVQNVDQETSVDEQSTDQLAHRRAINRCSQRRYKQRKKVRHELYWPWSTKRDM